MTIWLIPRSKKVAIIKRTLNIMSFTMAAKV